MATDQDDGEREDGEEEHPGERGRLACVISARGAHQELGLDELCARCHDELARAIPKLGEPLWSRAIAEKREPSNNARDNLRSLALCFAAVQSAESHQPVTPGTVRRMPE